MLVALAFALALAPGAPLPVATDTLPVRIYTSDGRPATFDALLEAVGAAEVIYLGERHDDSTGHAFQNDVFRRLHARLDGRRYVALSLEMFETDVQTVLDEYLAGLVTEQHFLSASRPWANYARDYRPLVEYAKAHALPVVAANAPRRYANRVSRRGPAALDSLFADAQALWLPPLPYPAPTPAYRARWDALMGGAPGHTGAAGGPSNMLMAQSLWDATMGHRIARALDRNAGTLVVHLVGGFHVEGDVGTPDAVRHYRPGTRGVVVAIRPAAAFDPAEHAGLGDFIVLTPPIP